MKIGRNEPCPCGSGKKYKHCCLRRDEEARRRGSGSGAGFGPDHGAEAPGGAGGVGSGYGSGPGPADAERLLLEQTGFSSPEELNAAMREYERYCEGLPSGEAPPTFMQYLGRANEASDVHHRLGAAMQGRQFAGAADVEAFLDTQMDAENNRPLDDFEGLSPAQMQEILTARQSGEQPLFAFNGRLEPELAITSPLVRTISWLLEYHVEAGGDFKLTARENYPRALCRAFMEEFAPGYKSGDPVPNEESLPHLLLAHDVIVGNGWTHDSQTRASITTEGVDVFSNGRWDQLFIYAFTYLWRTDTWVEYLGEEFSETSHFDIIQNSLIFSLYLLRRHPTGTVGELFDRFARAFPAYVEPAQGEKRVRNWFGDLYAFLFVVHFCAQLGLLKPGGTASGAGGQGGLGSLDSRYKTTELFRKALIWDI